MSLSIVVPVYNANSGLVEMFDRMFLDGLTRFAPAEAELILVDDASPLRAETEACVKRLEAKRRVRYIRNSRNLGYPKTCNIGMRLASTEFMLLANTDIRLVRGAIDALVAALSSRPDAGIVAPVTNNAAGFTAQQVNGFPGIESYSEAELSKIDRFADAVKKELDGFWEAPWLMDFCSLFRTELFSKVGYGDEAFGLGYGDDVDYCLRARALGFKLLVHRAIFVFHGGLGRERPDSNHFSSQSMKTRPLKRAFFQIRNAVYLKLKHGRRILDEGMRQSQAMTNPDIRSFEG